MMSGGEEKLIIGKQVYLSAFKEVRPAAIHIKGGKIIGIYSVEEGKQLNKIPTTEIPDECVVLPGIVDSHVHVNEPGRTHWEGFASATRAAAAGGVTTLADMPLNSIPPTTTVANFEEKLKSAHKKCWMDTCFIGGAVHDNASHLKSLLNTGIRGFKCFLIHSGVDEFTHVSEEQARLALKQLQGTASFLMFHAEVEIPSHSNNSKNRDSKEYKTFLESRPKEMENKAIDMVIKLCKETNVKCHIVHLSSSEALPLIRQAKAEGVPISVETCFHYLYFDAENIPKAQPKFKCCPPIREKENRDKLWEGLREGLIDMVVSDHSPCTPELKKKGGGDYLDSWGGISSLQFGLSILFTEATRRGFSYSDIVRWMAEKPAALLGLADRKGFLDVGYDADLVIFNPTKEFVVKPDSFYFKNKMSAYEDQKLKGTVQATFLRGSPIYYQGKFPNISPQGNLLLGAAGDITPQSPLPLKKLVSKL